MVGPAEKRLNPLLHVQENESESPDDAAQARIASGLSAYAGAFTEGAYPVGRLNPTVYVCLPRSPRSPLSGCKPYSQLRPLPFPPPPPHTPNTRIRPSALSLLKTCLLARCDRSWMRTGTG